MYISVPLSNSVTELEKALFIKKHVIHDSSNIVFSRNPRFMVQKKFFPRQKKLSICVT